MDNILCSMNFLLTVRKLNVLFCRFSSSSCHVELNALCIHNFGDEPESMNAFFVLVINLLYKLLRSIVKTKYSFKS